MPDMIAIGQGLSAVKALTDLVKIMVGLRDSAKLLEATVEFNQHILSVQGALLAAQSEQTTLIERVRALEKEIADLKAWEAEKQRYELKEVAPRKFAYLLKPDAQAAEPPHWICASCYQKGQKSILQGEPFFGGGWTHSCPLCKAQFFTK